MLLTKIQKSPPGLSRENGDGVTKSPVAGALGALLVGTSVEGTLTPFAANGRPGGHNAPVQSAT